VTGFADRSAVASIARLSIDNGTLEALKWLALVLMTGDHVNKYLFGESVPGLFELGRLAMPLFMFVLAYNLARPGALAAGLHRRISVRLAVFGTLATLPYIAITGVLGGWWPLNMLFTLLLLTGICWLIELGTATSSLSAVVLFSLGGSLVEYWWPGLLLGMACWLYCKRPNSLRLVGVIVACIALWPVNHNYWALACVPILLIAPKIHLRLPRSRYVFYAYYPAHLGVLWMWMFLSGPHP
jgi:TraX protein